MLRCPNLKSILSPLIRCLDSLCWGLIASSASFYGSATIMALDRSRINVPLRLLVIPLLVSGFPDLGLAAPAANERSVQIKSWETAVSIDVRKFVVVGWRCRWMMSLLKRCKAQNPLSLANLFLGWIAASINVLTHLIPA